MDLSLPDKDPDDKTPPVKVDENRTMTVMMGENNKMVYYMGLLATPKVGPKDIAYGKDGIRKELLKQKKEVLAYSAALGKPKNGIIVIIKPTKKATYRNLVDMLDEMAITGVDTYAIVPEFSPEETKLIDKK